MAIKIIDNAFIFFKTSLAAVFDELGDPQESNIFKYDFVNPDPSDTFRQITNFDQNINFGNDYRVELVTHCDSVLLDITPNTTLVQFNHLETGFDNFLWQIQNVGVAFYTPLHIKITHYAGAVKLSDLTVYSSPFKLAPSPTNTTVYDYWSYGMHDGHDFQTTSARLSIRLKGTYTKPTRATEVQTYTQVSNRDNGIVIHNKSTSVLNYNYIVEYYNNIGMHAFEGMVGNDVIYLNKVRATNIIPSTEDVLGTSNFYSGAWVVNLNRREILTPQPLIGTAFKLLQNGLQPFSAVTLAGVQAMSLKGFFNKDITIGTGTITVYDKTLGAVLATYTQSDVSLVGSNGFEVLNFIGAVVTNGDYYVTFTSGLFISPIGETYRLTSTIDVVTGFEEWHFEVDTQADFDPTDFEPTDFFT